MTVKEDLKHGPKRLSWRVPFLVFLWLLPHLFQVFGYPMGEEIAKPYREACIGALVVAFGAWAGKQGRRRPGEERKDGT